MFKVLLFALLSGVFGIAKSECSTKSEDSGKRKRTRNVSAKSLLDIVDGKFRIGVAMNSRQSSGRDTLATRLIPTHFNSIVAENCMKSGSVHPEEHRYDFRQADEFVEFGEKHDMFIVGHCLIWHSQLPSWFFVDSEGNDVSAEELKQRMKAHITTVVQRYRGRVGGWDVVNEAIMENGDLRRSKFYRILGEEFISLAFQYAHEADPDAELYYNDYNMHSVGKRDRVCKLVKEMRANGLRVDAIGMQGHYGLDYPGLDEVEESIKAFAATGCKVMITEVDMSALPTVHQSADVGAVVESGSSLNPYPNGLPDEVKSRWNGRMQDFFNLFMTYSDDISRVTLWGLRDGDSWLNNFPVHGRHDYPLLFDREGNLKGVFE